MTTDRDSEDQPTSPYTKEQIAARIKASMEIGALDFNVRGGFSQTDAFYLSFADGSLPEGNQWLGGCYIRGESVDEVALLSHVLGINPGGEVQYVGPFPATVLNPEYENRLLNREEINQAIDQSKL